MEEDSFNTNSKQSTESTEEITNASCLKSLLKTHMNDKLSAIVNNLAKKVKKAEFIEQNQCPNMSLNNQREIALILKRDKRKSI